MTHFIFVTGMHRSGTSVIARGLQVLGADLGNRLMPPGIDNLKGFFEDVRIVQLNDALLNHFGATWKTSTPLDWLSKMTPEMEDLYARASEIVESFIRTNPHTVAIKDPRISVLLPFWEAVMKAYRDHSASCVLAVRHPYSVAMSLYRRDRMTAADAFSLWYRYYRTVLDNISWPFVIIDYDAMIQSPVIQLSRLAALVGDMSVIPLSAVQEFGSEFITPGLRHWRVNDDPVAVESASLYMNADVTELWEKLSKMAKAR